MFYSVLIRISAFSDKSNQTAALDIPLTAHLQTQQGKHLSVAVTRFMAVPLCTYTSVLGFLACVHMNKFHMLEIFVAFVLQNSTKGGKQIHLKCVRMQLLSAESLQNGIF